MKTAVIAITRNGAHLAARLREGLPGAELHVLRRYAGPAGKGALPFDGELGEVVARLWPQVSGFVFIMATGIVVRLVAPLLEGKERDPAVVVMDDAGRFAISLLSGHLGGANELACRCAFLSGAREVITTATDANCLPSFDMLAKEAGWNIDDLSRVKVLNALLLDGEEIAVVDLSDTVRPYFHGRGRLTFHETFVEALQSGAKGFVFVTNRHLPPQIRTERLLVLRPRNLVLGIGCNSGTSADEIEQVACSQLKRLFLSIRSVRCIATAEAKRGEEGLLAFAAKYQVPVLFYESRELNLVEIPSPPSLHAINAIGAAGVAEPAALLAAEGGHLLLKKVKSGNVTLAIAETE
ncbi:cobalt-precorrin 5A hydrolase [Geobacter sp. DSM 9736]|uniref:cobalt-precorrin 5A hydrolase n=1 Tax=Geobacter sp. DSM 9736 TaxID=1277350 RepID=UPI000B50AFFC|nr:cobalamin biosynthesis protein [Geobacter sp. DSM 9736]SNB46974.1 cobalt-precorrin 5A acetaldehyde-lyase [Geobacter sp. DSM 9736]